MPRILTGLLTLSLPTKSHQCPNKRLAQSIISKEALAYWYNKPLISDIIVYGMPDS